MHTYSIIIISRMSIDFRNILEISQKCHDSYCFHLFKSVTVQQGLNRYSKGETDWEGS